MRMFYTIAFVTLFCVSCFGQTSYKGLTPGQSTRADVDRVLGQPVKSVSKTLIEYKSPGNAGQLFVQYRNDSPAAIVERIERACQPNSPCADIGQLTPPAEMLDAKVEPPGGFYSARPPFKRIWYWGAPRFVVYTELWKTDRNPGNAEIRLAFYSKELYESAAPQGCTDTVLGTWESDSLGRMNILRDGDNGNRGTYSKNTGSFTLNNLGSGKWKDDTGSGTINIKRHQDGITVEWRRTAGTGRGMLFDVARCVQSQDGGSPGGA